MTLPPIPPSIDVPAAPAREYARLRRLAHTDAAETSDFRADLVAFVSDATAPGGWLDRECRRLESAYACHFARQRGHYRRDVQVAGRRDVQSRENAMLAADRFRNAFAACIATPSVAPENTQIAGPAGKEQR